MGKKDIRANFRSTVFTRDKNKCKICGRSDVKLDAHHITNRDKMPNGGYVASNGITLCDDDGNGCHMKAENFYYSIYMDCDFDNPLHPNCLYRLIGSSKEQAFKDSEKL